MYQPGQLEQAKQHMDKAKGGLVHLCQDNYGTEAVSDDVRPHEDCDHEESLYSWIFFVTLQLPENLPPRSSASPSR